MVAAAVARGFDAPPQIVSPSRLDAMVAGGARSLYRGADAAGVEGLLSGPLRYGGGLAGPDVPGTYGDGIYFTTRERSARGYGDRLVRAVLHPGAKVARWEDMDAQIDETYPTEESVAIAQGYDAIEAPNGVFVVLNRGALIVEVGGPDWADQVSGRLR